MSFLFFFLLLFRLLHLIKIELFILFLNYLYYKNYIKSGFLVRINLLRSLYILLNYLIV